MPIYIKCPAPIYLRQTFTVKPAPLPGEEGSKWNPATWVVRAGGAWTGAVGYSTLFCAVPCILGCTLLAGEGEGGSAGEPLLQAGRRLRSQPIVPALPRRRQQLPAALAAAPGSARGSAAAAGRVCQHRAQGPGLSLPRTSRRIQRRCPREATSGHAE